MKRALMFLLLLILIVPAVLVAQDDDDDEIPLPPQRYAQPKLGGGIGFTPQWLFLDLDPLNRVITSHGGTALKTGGMPLFGGGGYAYILFVQNLRIGGMGVTGKLTSKAVEIVNPQTQINRDVDLSVGYGGVSVEYVVPIVPRLDLAFGGVIGGGNMTIKITRNVTETKIWNNLWNEFEGQNNINEYSRTLTGNYFAYQPSVNLEYAVLRWLGVRVGASYLGTIGNNWKLDENYDIVNVPDNINSRGFMLNAGLFLGTFIF
jgi:hypothetical protein